MSGLVDKGRAAYVDCFDLSKVFPIILHSNLIKDEEKMSGRENSEALKSWFSVTLLWPRPFAHMIS